jgi:peptidoglycan hydrolase-like protein with peptidoglycan-binding domain
VAPPKLKRALHLTNPFMKGDDVRQMQQLLESHGFPCGGIDGEYGPATAEATKRAKFALGYPQPKVDGAFGPVLLGLLTGTIKTPADYAKRAQARKAQLTRHGGFRAAIVEHGRWGIAHEPQIHYQQSRPIDGLGHPRKLPLNTDCSGFVTDCYNWAGAPDPNGRKYNGEGFTGTLLATGRRITKSQARPGDLVVYGPGTGHHVCMVLEAGEDPLLVSHGQEKGPLAIRHSAEVAAQPPPVTFLSYLN